MKTDKLLHLLQQKKFMRSGGALPLPKAQLGNYIPLWLNPKNWGVTNYSDKGSFDSAYSTAKKAGEQEFMFNNKRYNTKYAGTPRQEVGRYGVDGKPVHPMDLNHPAQVNLYPMLGKYLPGHIEASIADNQTSVNYSKIGNYPFGIDKVENKGEKSFNVYGQDDLTFSNKAASLPTGSYMVEDKYNPSDWNLFTNNCADNVCDAFGIPRSKGIQTPSDAMNKIKEKYTTQDVTGRTYDDYYKLYAGLQNQPNEKILSQANNILGIASSPEIQKSDLSKRLISTIQGVLAKEGYDLSKSLKQKGNYDGVLGDETKKALLDYQKKLDSKKEGGLLLKAQTGIPSLPMYNEFQVGGPIKYTDVANKYFNAYQEGFNEDDLVPIFQKEYGLDKETALQYARNIHQNPFARRDTQFLQNPLVQKTYNPIYPPSQGKYKLNNNLTPKQPITPDEYKHGGSAWLKATRQKYQIGGLPKAQEGLQYVPNGTYGNYYDQTNQQYIPQIYLPDVDIVADRELPFQNGKFASFLAARGMVENDVLADPIAMAAAATAGGVGLGAYGVSQIPKMFARNLASEASAGLTDVGKGWLKRLSKQRPGSTLSEPIFSPEFYESKTKLDEVRQRYIDAINQKSQPKSLDDITKDVDALNETIVPRSQATTEDLQSLLERLQNINKDLEKHIPKKLESSEIGSIDDIKSLNPDVKEFRDPHSGNIIYSLNKEDYNFGDEWNTIARKDFSQYASPHIDPTRGGYSDIPNFNNQLRDLRGMLQFGRQPLEKPLFRRDIAKSIQDNLAEDVLFRDKFIQEQILKDDLSKTIDYGGKPVTWSPRASEYKIKMKDFKPFGGLEAWRQGLYPNKQGGSIMNVYQKGGGIKDMVVSEIWEKVTGTKWSQAKKLGLSDGSYDTNIKLRQMLINEAMQSKPNFGKFVGKTSSPIPASSAMVNQLRQEGLAQANVSRDNTKVPRPIMPSLVGPAAGRTPAKSVPLQKIVRPTNQTASANTSAVARPTMAPVVGRAQPTASRSVVTQPVIMPINTTAPASTTRVRQTVMSPVAGRAPVPLQQQAEKPVLVPVTPRMGQPTYPQQAEESGSMFPNLSRMATASMLNMLPVVGGVQAANTYGPMFAGNAARSVADQSLQQLPSFVGNYLRGKLLNLPPILTEDQKKEVAYAIQQGEKKGYGVPKEWEKKGFTGSAGYDEFRSGRNPLNALVGLTDPSYWGDGKAMNRVKRLSETNWDAANAMLSLGKFNFKKNPDGGYNIGDQYNFEEYPYQANPSNVLEYMENPNIQVAPSEINIPAEYFTKQKKKGGSKQSLKIKIRKK